MQNCFVKDEWERDMRKFSFKSRKMKRENDQVRLKVRTLVKVVAKL